jgi:hypothetical protein
MSDWNSIMHIERRHRFYRSTVDALRRAGVPFLVGGGHALAWYTGIDRLTKDLDIFVKPGDQGRARASLTAAGYRTELSFPHWLAKAHGEGECVDIIFSSGNGIATVDKAWFDHAVRAEVLGTALDLVPAEEMIWSKSFVMERERFDGADIIHLVRARAAGFDWRRLLARFGPHWRVLLSHVVLFGFVYPDERGLVPDWVMGDLLARLASELDPRAEGDRRLCQGTLISREQYLSDVREGGYIDARLPPHGRLTRRDIEIWTADIGHAPPRRTLSRGLARSA